MINTVRGIFRHLTIGTLAGFLAGAIAGGVGSRLAMRITALMTDDRLQGRLTEAQARVGEITAGGTLFLIFTGALFGVYGGLLYRVTATWLPGKLWLRGLLFGCILLLAHGSAIIEGDNFDFDRFGSASANITMFALLPVVFGVIVAYAEDWLERVFPFVERGPGQLLYLPAILGVIVLVLVTTGAAASLSPQNDDGFVGSVGQARVTLAMVVVIACSMVFEANIKRLNNEARVRAAILIGPAVLGGMLLVGAIRQILS